MAISKINTNSLADAGVTSAKAETLMQPLGVGQTWTDVSGSRAFATTYTNSTGRPITVAITTVSTGGAYLVVNGVSTQRTGATATYTVVSAVVPSGGTYSLGSGGSITAWTELR